MYRGGQKGSITVFLSLTCILFLALICTVIESARVQGAKAQTANILGMGNISLLGEFEKELLERYEVFAFDGAYGSGKFQTGKIQERMETFLTLNTSPNTEGISSLCFDPWNLDLSETKIEKYALLTDNKGEAFYQQVVSFMKQNIGLFAVEELLEYRNAVDEIREYEDAYEQKQKENDGSMSALEGEKQKKIEALESEAAAQVSEDPGTAVEVIPQEKTANPLKEIAKLRKKSTLDLVTWDKSISGKRLTGSGLPSRSSLRKGTMSLEKDHSGVTANVLFREYLIQYFSNYLEYEEEDPLDYQIEYLIGGKKSDKENLKYVVNRLLLIREGMNYLYCLSNQQISGQANALAVSLTGFLGIPALTAATGQALLLAWAYGESLLDVRILLDGGKVPLNKDALSWSLSLENLGRLTELLQTGADKNSEGLSYSEYLRILLHMGNLSSQKMRALDLIQTELQENGDLPEFQAQNCVVAVKTSASWNCKEVFWRLPMAVMGFGSKTITISQEGSIGY